MRNKPLVRGFLALAMVMAAMAFISVAGPTGSADADSGAVTYIGCGSPIGQQEDRLYETYRGIVERAPRAELLVFNYPEVLQIYQAEDGGQACIPNGVSVTESIEARDITDALNEAIRAAVAKVEGETGRATVVDVRPAFEGKGACITEEYINRWDSDKGSAAYHPTEAGWGLYLTCLRNAVAGKNCSGEGSGISRRPAPVPEFDLGELEGSIVRLSGSSRGEPTLWVSGGRLLHIGTAADYWDCHAMAGGRETPVPASYVASAGWPVDWSGTTDRCGSDAAPPSTPPPAPVPEFDLGELEGSIVRLSGSSRGEPTLWVSGGRLLHIGTAADYWDCHAMAGGRETPVPASYVASAGWPVDWSGTTDRC